MTAPIYNFGEFRLDGSRYELLRNGSSIKLERKPMELLLLLAESRGRLVTREEISERLWKGEVFVDTEHGINTAIRKIRTVLRDDSESPHFVQTVTGKGYRFIATVVKEYPEPSKSQAAIAEPESIPASVPAPAVTDEAAPTGHAGRQRRRIWIPIGGGIAVVVIGGLALASALGWDIFHRRQPAITSIAVLPLDNLSGDGNQDYFAAGMTDELTTMLAKDSTLRVTSRTSAMQYKGAHRPLRDIAKALNVDAIVEGSVERTGDHVHMTLQLIRAATDSHIWANSYDRDNNDTSTLPDEVAREIAGRLNRGEASAKPVKYVNPAAHDDFLQGQYLWYVGKNDEAGTYFEKAVASDPNYAAGWAGVSEYLSLKAMRGEGNAAEILAKAEAAARKSVELDDTSVLGHANVAAVLLFHHWDAVGALQEINRAIEFDPQDSQSLHLKAKILCATNRFDEANRVQELSTEANIFAHPGARAEIFNCTREFENAKKEGLLRLQEFPNAVDVLEELAYSYHWTGDDKTSVEYLALELKAEGDEELSKAVRKDAVKGGFRAAILDELDALKRGSLPMGRSPVHFALLFGMLRDKEDTIRSLTSAVDQHSPSLVFFLNTPFFDFLHDDPRFQALAKRVGLPYEPATVAVDQFQH